MESLCAGHSVGSRTNKIKALGSSEGTDAQDNLSHLEGGAWTFTVLLSSFGVATDSEFKRAKCALACILDPKIMEFPFFIG